MDLGGKRIDVNTSDFNNIDYADLFSKIEESLIGVQPDRRGYQDL